MSGPRESIELLWSATRYLHSIERLADCMAERVEALEPDGTTAALEAAKEAASAMRDGIAAMASDAAGKLETAQGMMGRWLCDIEREAGT